MSRPERHFFVCENARPEGGKPSCAQGGSGEVLRGLLAGLAQHRDLWGRVAVSSTGCLGPCFDGPTVVVYPEGTWYARVSSADVEELVHEHMVGGRPVTRLEYNW